MNILAMAQSETRSTASLTLSDTSTSSQMTESDMITINTYIDFLHAYQNQFPDSMIVLIGDRKDKGNTFGTNLITVSDALQDDRVANYSTMVERQPLRKICILKGGIDAVKVEHPELLTKSPKTQTEQSMVEQFAKYVKKHR